MVWGVQAAGGRCLATAQGGPRAAQAGKRGIDGLEEEEGGSSPSEGQPLPASCWHGGHGIQGMCLVPRCCPAQLPPEEHPVPCRQTMCSRTPLVGDTRKVPDGSGWDLSGGGGGYGTQPLEYTESWGLWSWAVLRASLVN